MSRKDPLLGVLEWICSLEQRSSELESSLMLHGMLRKFETSVPRRHDADRSSTTVVVVQIAIEVL